MRTPFSRQSPSPRFVELTRLYSEMHREGDRVNGISAEKTFSGISLLPVAPQIKRLVDATGAATLLDYGCGKASQYGRNFVDPQQQSHPDIVAYWGVQDVHRYDPAVAEFCAVPQGRFDGVICTDVLEHCPEEDMAWIVDELFAYANMFVFANVACYPAHKLLPNGENAHCTIRPPDWWDRLFDETAARHGGVDWEVWVANIEAGSLTADNRANVQIRRIGSDI
jgi:hypothetical protein